MSKQRNTNVSIEGLTLALTSGMLVGGGLGLIGFRVKGAKIEEVKEDEKVRAITQQTIGFGFAALGLYLMSPNWLRNFWMVASE